MAQSRYSFMALALREAEHAASRGEVPVGAVIVDADRQVLTSDHNRTIGNCDPSAHAEINVLRAAARRIQNYRLLSTTLYVTVEPCVMCMGALVHSRIENIVFGARDPKWGAAGSIYNFSNDGLLNHKPEVIGGVLEEACSLIIQDFFRSKR